MKGLKITACFLAIVCLPTCILEAYIQKGKSIKAKAQQATKTEPFTPVKPLSARIAIHRDEDTVCYLDFQNNDPKRTITEIEWWIFAYDLYRKESTARFRFWGEPIAPVAPKQSSSVMDELANDFPLSSCRNYSGAVKSKIRQETDIVFLPLACTKDSLWVVITNVKYSDGSEYKLPGWE